MCRHVQGKTNHEWILGGYSDAYKNATAWRNDVVSESHWLQASTAEEGKEYFNPSRPRSRHPTLSSGCWTRPCVRVTRKKKNKIAMRIIRRQRRRSTGTTGVPRYSRRRQRCPENGVNTTASAASRATVVSGVNSGGAGDLRSSKMSDPMYNVLMGLVVVAAVVSVTYFTTFTIVPRAILAMGMMACIWNVIENLWGNDEIVDE